MPDTNCSSSRSNFGGYLLIFLSVFPAAIGTCLVIDGDGGMHLRRSLERILGTTDQRYIDAYFFWSFLYMFALAIAQLIAGISLIFRNRRFCHIATS